MQINGWWIANKPLGWSSAQIVAYTKRKLYEMYPEAQKIKLGHMGAIDPLATGVLPIGVGTYTKQMDYMLTQPKTYVAAAKFGFETDTEDLGGYITNVSNTHPNITDLETAVAKCSGEIYQQPSNYSAININGVRAYKLARNGHEIEIPARKVTIYSIQLNYYEYPNFGITVTCGSGTYIRALIRDIGRAVHSAATMTYLRRTKYGKFDLCNCISEIQS